MLDLQPRRAYETKGRPYEGENSAVLLAIGVSRYGLYVCIKRGSYREQLLSTPLTNKYHANSL